mmetsp:Transcript_17910/g.40462  ORF Transcript_17910/g.40462 Transcript_17910/m.40462 type:complete len:104 (+) Transcript_17910:753-1064(+)
MKPSPSASKASVRVGCSSAGKLEMAIPSVVAPASLMVMAFVVWCCCFRVVSDFMEHLYLFELALVVALSSQGSTHVRHCGREGAEKDTAAAAAKVPRMTQRLL